MANLPKPELKISQASQSGIRLDKYLATEYPELSRARLQKLIKQGLVLVNNLGAKASQRLNTGDVVHVSFPPPQPAAIMAEPIPLSIVYEDNDIIVINKPAGITAHPTPGHSSHTLVNALLSYYPDLAADFEDSLRPGIVHRLDKDTSGLMIMAKNSSAQRKLINQFKTRSISKTYLVLVRGKLSPVRGIIEAPIGRDPANRKRMTVVDGGRQAKTSYRVKEYLGNHTLLEVTTETGRTHQIRVHLSAVGYPVIGDPVYGAKVPYLKRQFVHASRLGFRLPSNGEYREFTSQLPPDLKQAMDGLR